MHILVIGAAGMVGRKLTDRLVADGHVADRAIDILTLVDVVEPATPTGFSGQVKTITADLSAPGSAETLVRHRPDLIYHLAAIVSGEAEADFDKGYRINLDGTRYLFEAIRQEGLKSPYCPRVVFTSSIAVFGAPFPARIHDEFFSTPLTSYGTQKAIGELLLSDYSRRGFFDGIGIRLPTICIRPGKPNKAALRLLLRHPPRTSGGTRGRAARVGRRTPLVREPPCGGRLPDPCGRHRYGTSRWAAATSACRASRQP